MDKQRLQQLAGIVTEAVKKCSCGCDADKCKCKPDCDCGCNKVVEYAQAFGQDSNDGTGGGGGVEAEEIAAEIENEEGRAEFANALQVIAKEIVKAVPQPPAGQEADPEEIVDQLMQGRWREMLKDQIHDLISSGPSQEAPPRPEPGTEQPRDYA